MTAWMNALTKRLWPELETLHPQRRLVGLADVATLVLTAPLALAGLAWLVLQTDLGIVRLYWPALLFLAALMGLFNRVVYFLIVEMRTDRYGSTDGSLAGVVQWAALFLFGPTTLWLSVLWSAGNFAWEWPRLSNKAARWNQARAFSLDLARNTLAYLVALALYARLGGRLPLPDLNPSHLLQAVVALLAHYLMVLLIWSPYIAHSLRIQRMLSESRTVRPVLRFILLALSLPTLADPFGILAAGLWVEHGPLTFSFLMAGLLIVAVLARRLSWAAESSRQQSRQLARLDQLSQAIIRSVPGEPSLEELLSAHLPNMFPSGKLAVWLAPDQFLYRLPEDWDIDFQPIWQRLGAAQGAQAFPAKATLPWELPGEGRAARPLVEHAPVVVAPITDVASGAAAGLVYLELRTLAQPWTPQSLRGLFPAVQSLAAQVASALHQEKVYEEVLAYQRASQELAFAGRIQASFLPNEMPSLEGWELAVTLLPARETSGDFFDIILLDDDRVGILIADVADKGLGAALYMALSRTLIRTFAFEYQGQPDLVLDSANRRILEDARANIFVTAFYAVLDPTAGTLVYCNAGHTTQLLLRAEDREVTGLTPTGMPVGIDEDAVWRAETVEIQPGDALILYTDGIPDAQTAGEDFFGERRLLEIALDGLGLSAQDLQTAIIDAVQDFVGGDRQYDDITLLVLQRNE